MILDAECLKPIHSECNMVEPSRECQLVLRHFFNDSGVYCINVSMANDVSLAVTSARFNIEMGEQQDQLPAAHRSDLLTDWNLCVSGPAVSSSGAVAMLLGVLVLVLAAGIVAYSYK